MFNAKEFFHRPFELTLAVYEAAIDWGYAHEEAEQPERVPYACELRAVYTPSQYHVTTAVIATHGYVYPNFDGTEFTGWNLERFHVDYSGNSDMFDTAITQDNEQGYSFEYEGENLDYTHSQIAADALDSLIADLPMQHVHVEYPNGFINLVTPENYPSE